MKDKLDTAEETDEKDISVKDQKEWRKRILGINDRKLLDYICDLCEARRSLGKADHNVTKKDKTDKEGNAIPSYYNNPPRKMNPVSEETDNPDTYE